jgi:hypothetical protein
MSGARRRVVEQPARPQPQEAQMSKRARKRRDRKKRGSNHGKRPNA